MNVVKKIEFEDITDETQKLLEAFEMSSEDVDFITHEVSVVSKKLESVLGDFYDWMKEGPLFEQFFHDPVVLKGVQQQQTRYWQDFFHAPLNPIYLENRRKIGQTHALVGLKLDSYFMGMNKFQLLWTEQILSDMNLEDKIRALTILAKKIHLDMFIVSDTYNSITNKKIADQNRALMEMSTPVTSIWEGVLLLPIVGILDSKRTQDMMDSILEKIARSQAIVTLLDISGVAIVDTAVANHLIKVTKSTKLMGCETIISGISPSIAHTIVDLGIDVGEMRTTATLKDALLMALEKIGYQFDHQHIHRRDDVA